MPLDFSLSQEQEAIRDLAHEFAVKEIRPVAAHFDETEEFPYEVVKKAHRLGLSPAAFLPEEYGGQGLDFLTELILNEELSWGCAGIAVCIQSMGLAIAGIKSSWTEAQKQRWLPEFTNPDKLVIGGLGLTEPDSGSDALSMKTRATRVGDEYVLNGTKQFCTNGGIADYHVIYANTDPTKGPAGIASFLVPKGTPGLKMGQGAEARRAGEPHRAGDPRGLPHPARPPAWRGAGRRECRPGGAGGAHDSRGDPARCRSGRPGDRARRL